MSQQIPSPPPPKTIRGEAVIQFAFDVANEIATDQIRELLSCTPTRFVVQAERTILQSIPLYQPLEIEPKHSVTIGGRSTRVLIRVYDIGVITLSIRTPVELATLNEAVTVRFLALDDGRTVDAWAAVLCAEVCHELQPQMTRPNPPTDPKGFLVFCLTQIHGCNDTTKWLNESGRAVAGLLTNTKPDRLSEMQVDETLRVRRTYERSDILVIGWDTALVVDLSGNSENELYILELANLQLVEFQALDQFLDRHLNAAYTDLDRHGLGWGRVSTVLRRLRRVRVEMTQLADQVSHITKFIGDAYLASVYLAAHERFALDHWRTSVESRLTQLDHIYGVVQSEAHDQRMLLLEIGIMILFVFDVLAIFLWK